MPLDVTIEISDAELDHFRSLMHAARERTAGRTPQDVAAAARAAVSRLRSTVRSPFVVRRIDRVDRLVSMLEDPEWQLQEPERSRVLDGLAYVANAEDLIPDAVPVLGLVDDAIMIELVLRELRHELDGYDDFDAYRREEESRRAASDRRRPVSSDRHRPVSRRDWLYNRREALHARIRERRERDLVRNGAAFPLITRF